MRYRGVGVFIVRRLEGPVLGHEVDVVAVGGECACTPALGRSDGDDGGCVAGGGPGRGEDRWNVS
jgi:hypothetical protein